MSSVTGSVNLNDVEEVDQIVCLFCPQTFAAFNDAQAHSQQQHQFNIDELSQTLSLDLYGRIRLVNFIRSRIAQGFPADSLLPAVLADPSVFSDEAFLKPVIENDAFLFNLNDDDDDDSDWNDDSDADAKEDDDSDSEGDEHTVTETTRDRMLRQARKQNEKRMQNNPELSQQSAPSHFTPQVDLKAENAYLRREAESSRRQATELTEALAVMQEAMMRLTVQTLQNNEQGPATPAASAQSQTLSVSDKLNDEDKGYFGGYSTRRIHELMLKDKIRTLAYQNFIEGNKHLFEGKTVLDVGCGTGILSLFAARAGAKHVYGVDAAEIAFKAREIVAANGYSDRITIIHSKIEDAVLPVESVDIIISEWMGYFLLFESMLPSVLLARDRWGAKGGVYPDIARMFICGVDRKKWRADKVEFWRDVYGFDMSTLIDKEEALMGSSVEIVPADSILTTASELLNIDCNTCKSADLDFNSPFVITMNESATVEALCVWFDNKFERGCTNPVLLDTAATEPPTHWMQTVFCLHEKITADKGDSIHGRMDARRMVKFERSYQITVQYQLIKADGSKGAEYVQNFTVE